MNILYCIIQMDFYTNLFWISFLTLVIIHAQMLSTNTRHAVISIVAASGMFLGSKIGREFLGIN
jgi:hypothetical protein